MPQSMSFLERRKMDFWTPKPLRWFGSLALGQRDGLKAIKPPDTAGSPSGLDWLQITDASLGLQSTYLEAGHTKLARDLMGSG